MVLYFAMNISNWWEPIIEFCQALGLTGPVAAFLFGLVCGGLWLHFIHCDTHKRRDKELKHVTADRNYYRNVAVNNHLHLDLPSSESNEYGS